MHTIFRTSALSLVASVMLTWSAVFADPLHDAAMTGDIETLQHLLEAGADPNSVISEGNPTPLYFAAERGHPHAVAMLIEHGADVNLLTFQGGALHIAARRGRLEIVQQLLDAGADPNLIGGERMTRPLHEAAYNGSIEIVTLLLDRGADVNGRTNYRGETPAIHFAATKGHVDVMKLLRERGFQPWTPEPITAAELASADLKLGGVMIGFCALRCHSTEPGKYSDRAGSLWNIVGKPKASDPGMAYSDAMKNMKGVWDFESLNIYLADATGSLPGTAKYFGTIRDRTQRIALIAYLRTLADDRVPLP